MADPIARQPRASAPSPMTAMCPYLVADGGAWRSSVPARAHRCTAVTPPAILAIDKQRRLCLTTEHLECATFVAARSLRTGPDRADARAARPTARAIARTTPVVLDQGRLALSVPTTTWRPDRSMGQAALVLLMVVAFAAILVARFAGADGSGPGAVAGATGTPAPSAQTTAGPSAAATPPANSASALPGGGSPSPSATETAAPIQTDAPLPTDAATTYVVRARRHAQRHRRAVRDDMADPRRVEWHRRSAADPRRPGVADPLIRHDGSSARGRVSADNRGRTTSRIRPP